MRSRIRLIVIDDLKIERIHLRRLVAQHPALECIGEAESAEEALPMILELKPDVLLLDVQLPGANGFELLQQLREPPKVVFVSAWPAYAVDALELDAVDYLLKPVTPHRFSSTVKRIERLFAAEESPPIRHEAADRICLRTPESTVFLPLQGISALRSDGGHTEILHAQQPPVVACGPLEDYEGMLPSPPFERVNDSLIINTSRLQKIEQVGGTALAWLKGPSGPISLSVDAISRLNQPPQRPADA